MSLRIEAGESQSSPGLAGRGLGFNKVPRLQCGPGFKLKYSEARRTTPLALTRSTSTTTRIMMYIQVSKFE